MTTSRPLARIGSRISRRQFLHSTSLATGAVLAMPALLRGQNLNQKLNIGIIGAGGRVPPGNDRRVVGVPAPVRAARLAADEARPATCAAVRVLGRGQGRRFA